MIDAGSSGSRVHVYTYRDAGPLPVLELPSQTLKLKPGAYFFPRRFFSSDFPCDDFRDYFFSSSFFEFSSVFSLKQLVLF